MLVRACRQNLGQKRNEEQRVISPLWATRTQSGTVVRGVAIQKSLYHSFTTVLPRGGGDRPFCLAWLRDDQ